MIFEIFKMIASDYFKIFKIVTTSL